MTIPRIAPYPMPTPDELPQNRVHWRPEAQRAALLIHDMQRYFLGFYDTEASPVTELLANIAALRRRCKALGIPVIYTAQPADQTPRERGLLTDFWGPGLSGLPEQQAIVAELAPEADDHLLTKWRYSAFQRTGLRALLTQTGRDQLIICGIYAHIGCLLTACDAFMQDIQPFLVADALADFSAQQHRMALDYAAQRCARTLPCSRLLDELGHEGDAAPPPIAARLRDDVAELLQQPAGAIGMQDNLLDLGLDSIRLMSLVERWRRAGMTVEFVELAEQPTLAAWVQILGAAPSRANEGRQAHG